MDYEYDGENLRLFFIGDIMRGLRREWPKMRGLKCELCDGTVLCPNDKDNRHTILANCEDYDDMSLIEVELKICRGCVERLFKKVIE